MIKVMIEMMIKAMIEAMIKADRRPLAVNQERS